jgi:uncharacterized circularly permuted ATP-grasp superfamily protein
VPYDEGRGPHYRDVLEALERTDLRAAGACIADHLREREVRFGKVEDSFHLDPVPRLLTRAEWEPLGRGLEQRVRALVAFFRDAYGAREIVRAGLVPEHVITGATNYEEALAGRLPDGPLVALAGIDVVRGEDGRFYVLEDNLRTPSGVAYMAAARRALEDCLDLPGRPWEVDAVGLLCRAIRAGGEHPAVVTDGPSNSAFYEHAAVAGALGAPLVTPADLEVREDGLYARGERVDAVYRRTDGDRLDDEVAAALLDPWLRGQLTLLNGFGAGVADDKLAHAYVEDMIRFYLGEEPLLPAVDTHDASRPEIAEEAVERLDEVVVKARGESGGEDIVIGPQAEPPELAQAARALRRQPEDYVVQETVWISEHPTAVDGALEPRHVDLRAFVICAGDEVTAIPGGLTRFARDRGALIVNSSQGGGAKDTWIVG